MNVPITCALAAGGAHLGEAESEPSIYGTHVSYRF